MGFRQDIKSVGAKAELRTKAKAPLLPAQCGVLAAVPSWVKVLSVWDPEHC